LLIANAGISTDLTAPIGIMTSDIELGGSKKLSVRIFELNVFGTIFSAKLFLYHCLKPNNTHQAGSKIIITGSEGGLFAIPSD
jgi:NAD(P)-dependent dehydrogenase (short-subunit alcohol dehydrogenase family)